MSKLTIAQLEAFYWTATHGSVDRAARTLNVSQPTISLRLRALEDALGYKPFQRVGRNLRLSLQGRALLDECRSIFASLEKIDGKHQAQRISGPIRLGFAEGFAMVCLPQIISRLHRDYPELQPELMVSTSAEVEPELHALKLDLAFLVHPTGHEQFEMVPLGSQETSWIGSTSWDLPPIVRPTDLISIPIISNPVGSINHQQMVGWFANAGLTPTRVDICNSVSILADLVNKGVGVGIYPNKLAERERLAGTIRILATDPPVGDTPIFAKFHRQARKQKIQAVTDTVMSVLAELDYLR